MSAATVATGWSGYFQSALGSFGLTLPTALAGPVVNYDPGLGRLVATGAILNLPAVVVVALVTVVLVLGIRESAGINAACWSASRSRPCLFVIAVGAFFVDPANWQPFAPLRLGRPQFFGAVLGQADAGGNPLGMLAGAALAFFAYIGFDSVSTHAEEAKQPQRDVPIGIVASLALCTVLYVAVVAVLTGMVPYRDLDLAAPVADAFRRVGLRWAQLLIALAGVAGITSVMLVTMLSQSRVLLAIARDGLLPARVLRRRASALQDALDLDVDDQLLRRHARRLPADPGAADAGQHGDALRLRGRLRARCSSCAAGIPRRRGRSAARWCRPVPLLGIASCLLLMFSLPAENWLRLAVWLGIGLVIYLGYGRKHSAAARWG